jgi:RNA polymerase sigma factor (sigma-70 family)
MSQQMRQQTQEMDWLRAYAASGSQEAFAALSRQYVNLVYASARRQVGGDAHLAEDVTQAVFIVLAQKPKSVPTDRPISAWLLKVTRYCAANARRMKQHRETHERKAGEMARNQNENSTSQADENENEELAPLLDEGLSKLRPADRDALLLKYFEQKSLREVGEALGVSEEAAQKRVTRAVDRLREFFRRRRGTTVSAIALAALLTSESSKAAPASVAASVGSAAAATTNGSTAAATLAKGAMVAIATQKTTVIVIGGLVLLLGIGGGVAVVHTMGSNTSGSRSVTLASSPAGSFVTFSDGSKVECVAISEITFGKMSWASEVLGNSPKQVEPKSWWKPDGSVAAKPDTGLDQVYLGSAPGRRGLRLVFDTTGSGANGADISFRVPGSQGYASSIRTIGPIRRTNLAVSLPDTTDKVDIRLGLAKGEWRRDVTTPVTTTSAGTAVSTTQPAGPIVYGKITDHNEGGCEVEMLRDRLQIGDRQRNIRVVTTDGKELGCNSSQGDGKHTLYHFPCKKEKIAAIIWVSRPYEWATMNSVALQPRESSTTTAPAQ